MKYIGKGEGHSDQAYTAWIDFLRGGGLPLPLGSPLAEKPLGAVAKGSWKATWQGRLKLSGGEEGIKTLKVTPDPGDEVDEEVKTKDREEGSVAEVPQESGVNTHSCEDRWTKTTARTKSGVNKVKVGCFPVFVILPLCACLLLDSGFEFRPSNLSGGDEQDEVEAGDVIVYHQWQNC